MAADPKRHLEELGVFVHGALFALHALGLIHNLRRRNPPWIAFHAVAAAGDLFATHIHARAVAREKACSER